MKEAEATGRPGGEAGAAAGKAARPRRAVRRLRRVVIGMLVMLVPVVALIVLTQGPVASWIVAGQLAGMTGAKVSVGWASLRPDGRLELTDIRMSVQATGDVDEHAARFASVGHVLIELDWNGVLAGVVRPTWVLVEDPAIRVSQSRRDASLNLAGLVVPKGGGGGVLPRVDVVRARLELGEHGPDREGDKPYDTLVALDVQGWVVPGADGRTAEVKFKQVGGPRLAGGATNELIASGTVDLNTGEASVSLSSVELSRWPIDRVPSAFREIWGQMRLRGELASTRLRSRPGAGVFAELELRDVSLNVPVPAGQLELTGGRTPPMRGVSGRIVFGPGGVEANLVGSLEDLTASVSFRSTGLGGDAPYTCTITARDFLLERDPRLLWYAPPVVQRTLMKFSGPTATLDAEIRIERKAGAADASGKVITPAPEIAGTLTFRNGEAAYDELPYRLRDLSGQIDFNTREVRLTSVRGRGLTGAGMFAEGLISPPTDDAAVDIRLTITDAPLDQELIEALDASPGKGLTNILFSRRDMERMLRDGLVQTPEDFEKRRARAVLLENAPDGFEGMARVEIDDEIRLLREQMSVPAFAFGGVIDRVEISLNRAPGPGQRIDSRIEVRLSKAGLVPENFPMPLEARGLRLVIDEDVATLTSEQIVGAGGRGRVDVRAEVPVPPPPKPGETPKPKPPIRVTVDAKDVPIDELVIAAIPDAEDARGEMSSVLRATPGELGALSVRRALRTLGLSGRVNAKAVIGGREDGTRGFDVTVEFEDLTSWPRPVDATHPARVLMTNMSGKVEVSEDRIAISALSGLLVEVPDGDGDGEGAGTREPGGAFVLDVTSRLPRLRLVQSDGSTVSRAGDLNARAEVRGLRLSLPIEDVLAAVSPTAARRVEDARNRYDPDGFIDADAEIAGLLFPAPENLELSATLRAATGVRLRLLDRPMAVEHRSGTASIRALTGARVPTDERFEFSFNDAVLASTYDDDPAGVLRLHGSVRLEFDEKREVRLSPTTAIKAELRGVRPESRIAARVLDLIGADAVLATLNENKVRGEIDAELSLDPVEPGSLADDPSRTWSVSGAVRPVWLALERYGSGIEFPVVSGQVTFRDTTGSFEQLTLSNDDWEAALAGTWSRKNVNGVSRLDLDIRPTLDGGRLEATIMASLPEAVRTGLRSVNTTISRGLILTDTRVTLSAVGDEPPTFDARGTLTFGQLGADVGIPLRDVGGTLDLHVFRNAGENVRFDLNLSASSLVAGVVTLGDARARLVGGEREGVLELRELSGRAAGGRLSGSAMVEPRVMSEDVQGGAAAAGAPMRQYSAKVEIAGVRFADLLKDISRRTRVLPSQGLDPTILRQILAGERTMEGAIELPEVIDIATLDLQGLPDDLSRGSLDAEISLSGLVGEETSRIGRGSVRIFGGDVVRIPLVVPLLRLTNLQLPFDEPLDFFHAACHLEGSRVTFDELALMSNSISIVGSGTMDLPTMGLDLRLTSQSAARLPLVSALLEGLRDEVVSTRITGTLAEPSISPQMFSAMRSMLARLLGIDDPSVPMTDDDAIRRAREERKRAADAAAESAEAALRSEARPAR